MSVAIVCALRQWVQLHLPLYRRQAVATLVNCYPRLNQAQKVMAAKPVLARGVTRKYLNPRGFMFPSNGSVAPLKPSAVYAV